MTRSHDKFKKILKAEFKVFEELKLEFVRELGSGGQGCVIQVKIKDGKSAKFPSKHFALKIFDGQNHKEVQQEIKKSLSAQNDHFVRIYDAETSDNVSFIAMELANQSLEDKIQEEEKEIGCEELEKILDNVGACMEVLALKFCHRDIKPANILQFNNGEYKLTDLGVGVKLHSGGTSTARVVLGTENYLSQAFKHKFQANPKTGPQVGINFTAEELRMEDSFNFGMSLF